MLQAVTVNKAVIEAYVSQHSRFIRISCHEIKPLVMSALVKRNLKIIRFIDATKSFKNFECLARREWIFSRRA
ncbi:hypothetical protein TW84_03550 [Vibrio neptunius]|nr:hypothetical protein TW84_03550 [Vibrio neptunius]